MTFLSNKARSDYYTNFLTENSTDQRRLFRASKSLLNLSKGSGLPLSANDYQLANDFGKFFAQKNADIRSDIRSVNTNQICLPNNATITATASCFLKFNLLLESEVFYLITASFKVARYSFSGSIPPKFERKLRRHKQRFGKINTTVVLDKDENLL